MKTREDLLGKAQEMMQAHGLEEIHVTTDGQGFTDKERAMSHSNLQKDKAVYHYHRTIKEQAPKKEDTPKVVDAERLELSEKYERLFDKKPAYNMGLEKMKTAIQEKEAEVSNTEVTTETTTEVEEEDTDSKSASAEEGTEEEDTDSKSAPAEDSTEVKQSSAETTDKQ